MWINRDVDLPQALVTAQREGRLVIFAGAGVSMGPPSNLPSFEALADAIAGGALTRKAGEGFDAFIGRADQHGVNVQVRARAMIDVPTSEPRPLHRRLAGLFRDESSVRLVTTNFDRHFTTTLRAKFPEIDVFTAPALPLGREWTGLIYLHGAVERARSHLVLSDRDFGLGYLADGWATRFLMEMFREFAVLFVGYSHTDPVMKYLARSFVGGTSRFALTPSDRDDHWTHLGIVPVHFPIRPPPDEYGAIDDAIESWTTTARMGVFDHQVRVRQLVELPPPLEPESIDYLRSVLTNQVTLQFFVQQASRIEWLHWTAAEGFLAPLIQRAPLNGAEPQLFAHWFAERFAIPHPREALAFVQQHSSTLNPVFADAIAFQLAVRTDDPPADVLRLWSAALMMVEQTPARSLSRLLKRCSKAADVETTLMLFRELLRPRLRFDPLWAGLDHERPAKLDADLMLRGDAYDLREVWERTLKPNIPALGRDLLPMVTSWLFT